MIENVVPLRLHQRHELYGVKVVVPSNPYDAKGLLMAAVQDDNLVVFSEDKCTSAMNCTYN
jgi:pyruvate/2-oxoglutarate/acetoin dehydrogenase E1 component